MNTRELAADTLTELFRNKLYSNIYLGKVLNESDLPQNDRGLFTEIVYGTIRYRHTIDFILNNFLKNGIKKLKSENPFLLNILRTAIYQIKYLDKVPDFAVVNEAVNIAKQRCDVYKSKFVNGVLRNYLRNKEKYESFKDNNFVQELTLNYSFQTWMVKLMIDQYGKEVAEKILCGLNERPQVTVRVNGLKTDYDSAFEQLEGLGYEVEEGRISPEAIYIKKGSNVEQNPLFKDGFITIQDESAMLVAEVMDIMDNLTVLDLCSAPGGKTTHIAELMNNTGEIFAFDIYEHKLELIKENLKRLDINNVELEIMDATMYNHNLVNLADRVLLDVPCSGLGIIRKKPEIKWSKNPQELSSLIKIQRDILSNAADYVKSGGTMVYSTCTINKRENIDNIEWFLEKDSRYYVDKIFLGNSENFQYDRLGALTVLPNQYMDGFFIAKLKRK